MVSTTNTRCYIGLGSNLQNPVMQLKAAITRLADLPNTILVKTSSFYQTTPVGPQDQPNFTNAVVALDTQLEANALLHYLQQIETAQGRVRTQRWGPRTLDLDILLFGNQIINSQTLCIPHPELLNRQFVLQPLLEIAPKVALPDGSLVCESIG